MTPDNSRRDPLSHIIGTCSAQICGIGTTILSPLIIGGLIVGLNIGEMEAGGLVTIELVMIAFTSLGLAPFMHRIPHHLLAIGGASLLLIANLFSAFQPSLEGLYLWRILAGAGTGCVIATFNAAIAGAASPVKLYGYGSAAAYTVTSIIAVTMTSMRDVITYNYVYSWLGAALVVFIPLLWFLPRQGGQAISISLPRESILSGCMLLVALTTIGIAMMAYYAFLERIAVLIGASAAQTGQVVAAAQVAGMFGGLLAAPLAARFKLINTLVTVVLLHALAIVLAIASVSFYLLLLTAFIEALLFIIMAPLMFTLAAYLDDKGRWAAAAGGVFILSTAIGPIVGALLIEKSGYTAISWLQLVVAVPAIVLFTVVNRTTEKETKS